MDGLDRQIVELLRASGRRSNVEIARAIGVSEATVRKRVDRLLAEGALAIRALADPAAAGYRVRALIFLDVASRHVDDVAGHLATYPEILSVRSLTAEHDLVAEVAVRTDTDLVALLRERVAPLEGVISTRTAHVAHTYREPWEWGPPEPALPAVLVADDDPDFTEVTRVLLKAGGYRVRTASSGRAALESLRSEPADLVVLDIMMDGILDGWHTGGVIRRDPAIGDTPILVVSSITSTDYLGMVPTDDDNLIDGFLSKPVDPEQFLREVGRLVRR